MNRFFLAVSRWAVWFYFSASVARVWYKLYQFIWERNTRTRIRRFDKLDDLVAYMRRMKWKADGWRQLWDAVSDVRHVQYLADTDPNHAIGDCDEFAVYEAAVVNNELIDDREWSHCNLGLPAQLLTVMWYATSGDTLGFGGHNVCLLSYRDGTWAYMDYGHPSKPRLTIQQVADDVRAAMAGGNCQAIGHVVSDPITLKVKKAFRT